MDFHKMYGPKNITHEHKGIIYNEEWKPTHDFYLVSSFGRFKSLRDNIIMRQYMNEKGYLTIGLNDKIGRKKYKSHRVVAMAFIHNPERKPQINHDDFIKANNFFMNLEWATSKENSNHAQRGGRKAIAKPKKPTSDERPGRCKKIYDVKTGIVYPTIYHLADSTGVSINQIKKKLSGERINDTEFVWMDGGYTMFYKKSYEAALVRFKELKQIIFGISEIV